MSWIREGYCCKCGDCCKGNPFDTIADATDGMCPMLSLTRNDGTRVCTVHDTDNQYWQNACSQWPVIPEHTASYPRCTFTWRWQP